MQANQHNNPPARNGQNSIEARAFSVAFIPPKQPNNLTQLWSLRTSETIGALIDFRSALHRWQANGCIPDSEFMKELEKLENCGLADWVDELIGLAVAAVCASGVTR